MPASTSSVSSEEETSWFRRASERSRRSRTSAASKRRALSRATTSWLATVERYSTSAWVKRWPVSVIHGDRAEGLVAHERQGEGGALPEAQDTLAGVGPQPDLRVGDDVGRPHRPTLEEGEAGHALAQLDERGPREHLRDSRVTSDAEHAEVRVVQVHGGRGDPEGLADLGGDDVEDAPGVDGGHEGAPHLGEGAHALGLLRRLPVEPGVLDGHGGLPGEGLGHVLIAATEGPPRAEGERADEALAEAQGQPHEMRVAERAVGGEMLGGHADQGVEGSDDGRAFGHHATGQALSHLDARLQHGGGGGAGEARHHEVLAVEESEARIVEVEEPHGLFGHAGEQGIGGGEQTDLLVDLEERGERGAAAALVGEEAGIVDGDGRLAAEGGHDLDLRLGHGMRLPPVDAQPTVRLPLDEDGHGEHAAIALALHENARLGGESHGGIAENVRRPDGRPLPHGAPGRPLAQVNPQSVQELARHPGGPHIGQKIRVRLGAEDSRRPRPREHLAALHDGVENLVELERGGEGHADLEEGAVVRGVLLRLAEELGVVDGDGGVAPEGEQKIQVSGGEGVTGPGEDVQHADQALAEQKGHGHRGHEALRSHPGQGGHPGLRLEHVHDGRHAAHRGPAGQPLTEADAGHAFRGRAGDNARLRAEAELIFFGDGQPRRAVRHEPLRDVHHRAQHVLERAGGGKSLGDAGEQLEPPALLLHLREEQRALHHLADLVGDRLEYLDLFGQEVALLLGDQRHHAPRAPLDGDGQSELRAVSAHRLEPGEIGIADGRRIDLGDDDPSRAGRFPDIGPLHRPHADLRRELRGETALRDEGDGTVGRVELMHASHVHLRESTHHVEHLARGGHHVGRAAHAEGDRIEGLELSIAPGQLGVYLGPARPAPSAAGRLAPAIEEEGRPRAGEGAHGEDEQRGGERLAAPFAPIRHEQPEPARPRHRHLARRPNEEVAAAIEAQPARGGRLRPFRGRRLDGGDDRAALVEEEHARPIRDFRRQRHHTVQTPREDHEAQGPRPPRLARPHHRRRGDDVRLAVEHGQARRRGAEGGGIGNGHRRRRGHLEESRPRGVEQDHQVRHPLEREIGEAGRHAAGHHGPIGPSHALDEGGVASEQPSFAPERGLRLREEGGHRLLGARGGRLAGVRELPAGDCRAADTDGGEGKRSQRDSEKQTPCRGAHEGTGGWSYPVPTSICRTLFEGNFPNTLSSPLPAPGGHESGACARRVSGRPG